MEQDKIVLEGMAFYGYHGVLPAERELGQRFRVSVHMYLTLKEAGEKDDLSRTLDYGEVYRKVEAIVTGKPVKLLETLAERVAEAVLGYDAVKGVRVMVEKTSPPLPGCMDGVKVWINRRGK